MFTLASLSLTLSLLLYAVWGMSGDSGGSTAPDSAPQDIQVASVTATNATVSWTPPLMPNGVIISYTISYSPVGGRWAIYGLGGVL